MQYSAHYRYPQSFPQSAAAVIACSHYQSPIVKYGTVERSDLAKCRQDELCCRRTIRRWNPEARGFRLMYGTRAADEKNFIHTPVSAKSSVHCTGTPKKVPQVPYPENIEVRRVVRSQIRDRTRSGDITHQRLQDEDSSSLECTSRNTTLYGSPAED